MDKQLLIDLKKVTDVLNTRKNELLLRQQEFAEANRELLGNIKASNEVIESYKDTIRTTALNEFAEDGIKSRLGGIGIRVSKELIYDDKKAFEWCKSKDMFLMLDVPNFEKIAKTGIVDFVEIKERPSVTFPKEILID
jgi:hypothetical protein